MSSNETITVCLKVLTQVSFGFPQDIPDRVIARAIQICVLQNDFGAQENAMKMLCNMLTDEKCCSLVLKMDGIFAIFLCLLSDNLLSFKYSAGAVLNLTTMSESRLNSCELICSTGGIAHIMTALQKSFALDQFETTCYLIKALTNLANYRAPIIKHLLVEQGHLEIALELIRLMFVTLVKHTADEQTESSLKIEAVKNAI